MNLGQNVQAEVEGKKLVLTVQLEAKGQPSSSGKTTVLASTRGGQAVETPVGIVYVGLNVYRK